LAVKLICTGPAATSPLGAEVMVVIGATVLTVNVLADESPEFPAPSACDACTV